MLRPLLIAVAALTLSFGSASADIISFQQGASPTGAYQSLDATIRSDGLTRNFGGDVSVIVGRTTAAGGPVLRGVYGFDLSAIPSDAIITNVSFQVWGQQEDTGSVDGNVTLELVQLTNSFTEGTGIPDPGPTTTTDVTWTNRTTATPWGTVGGDLGTLLSSAVVNTGTFNTGNNLTFGNTAGLISAVQTLANSDGTFYFAIKGDSAVETTNTRRVVFFRSDSSTTTAQRPVLTVEFTPVPEPSTLVLGGMAFAGLSLLAVRRRG